MEYWLIIFDPSYIFLKGRRIKKNLDYSLVSSWPSLYSQNVGTFWDCILLRLTSMFPYSITSMYVPTSTCSFPTALLFLALVQVCLGQLSLPKRLGRRAWIFQWVKFPIGCYKLVWCPRSQNQGSSDKGKQNLIKVFLYHCTPCPGIRRNMLGGWWDDYF